MPITTDFHLHTAHSADSDTPMEDMILKGISQGFEELCFTEHLDFDYPVYPDIPAGVFVLDDDAYETEFLQLQEKYAPQIKLHFGLECGMQQHCISENLAFIQKKPYEFVLASQHLCNGRDPYYADFFEYQDGPTALHRYFEETLQNIQSFHNFDSLGHIDYMVRYCIAMNRTYQFKDYEDILTAILEELVKQNKALELNTGGLRKGMTETNPGQLVFQRFREVGGKHVTIGSDAHMTKDLGADFKIAESTLKAAGFSHYTVFRNRSPIQIPF